jgi:hypothetical protein
VSQCALVEVHGLGTCAAEFQFKLVAATLPESKLLALVHALQLPRPAPGVVLAFVPVRIQPKMEGGVSPNILGNPEVSVVG